MAMSRSFHTRQLSLNSSIILEMWCQAKLWPQYLGDFVRCTKWLQAVAEVFPLNFGVLSGSAHALAFILHHILCPLHTRYCRACLLDFHQALSHGMANDAAHYACQAVLPKLHYQAEEALLYGVGQLSSSVCFKDCLGCPCNQLFHPCRLLWSANKASKAPSYANCQGQ